MSLVATLTDYSNPVVPFRQRTGRVEVEAKVVLASGTPDLTGNILTALNGTSIAVSQTNAGGTSTIVPSMPFGDFLFASLANDGNIVMSVTGSTGTVRGMIDLTNFGALPLGDKERIDFTFSGTFAGTAGSTIKLWALDMPQDATTVNWIDKTVIPAAQQYEINTTNARFLMVAKASVNSVEIQYADNNRRVSYTTTEAEAITRDTLQFRGRNGDKPVTGQDLHLLFIPCENATRVKLETNTSNVNVYTYVPKTY